MLRTTGLILVLAGLALGETQSGSVTSGGQPIPGATVVATCGDDKITTVTDDSGRFEMGGLPSTPCRFSVSMFGFDSPPRETTASASPLTFDLSLQAHATLPPDPNAPTAAPTEQAGAGRQGTRRRPNPADTTSGAGTAASASGNAPPGAAQQAANGNGPGRGGFGGPGRGGFGRGGRGANAQAANAQAAQGGNGSANQGFQNLSLLQNGDNQVDSELAPGASPVDDTGANQAFTINGSLSQGVQAQAGDNFGLGGAGGFGRGGFGGPDGGAGNPFAVQNGGNVAEAQVGGGPAGGGFGGGGGGRGGGGGFGGGGRGGRGGRGGGGPNRNFQFGNRINRGRRNQFQGNAYYTIGNSVLNARPYSFTSPSTLSGAEVPKAGYASSRFGFSGGGPLVIPHISSGDKTFWFVNYTGNRSKNGFDDVTTVPTLAERGGDFSALANTINFPGTTTPFANNTIPISMLNPTSLALLQYIPVPNAPGARNNYQLIGANPSNNDNLQTRINQTISSKDGLDVNFSYQHRNSETLQQFGFADPTSGYGLSGSLTYRRTISRTLINSVVWNFSRNLTDNLSQFSYGPNIEGNLGIMGVTPTPAQFGPPTLSFTNFGTLTDATPSSTRAQTSAVNEQLIQIHGKQTITYGFGFQRRQNNITSDSNARGTFNFTGVETGYDFSDYLLGLPYQTSVVSYLNDNEARYLRETALSAFATDDYRLLPNLTINGGLRWEYFSPYNEKNGQMANLDIAPGDTAVAQVLPGGTGPYSGAFPQGFIKPDYKLFSPRVGIAWKPFKAKQIVVRSGYGMYYNGGVYSQIAQQLVGQPPFATTTQVFQSTATPLSLNNGFPIEQSDLIANTFAVNKNYHPGYAQNYTASIQQTLSRVYVLSVAYNGIKGTDLDVLQLPNRAPLGTPQLLVQSHLLIPNTGEFTYDNSVGNSSYNAFQIQLQRRQARGMSFGIVYTYSKAIDDSSTLGGGPVLIPNNISAERALSPTDQRQVLRVNYQAQSPIGNMRTGFLATALRGWTIGGVLNATSGTPFTATINGDSSGTGYTGDARAEATGLPVTSGSGFFNPLAFAVPATGTFGNAGRDTIPGIPQFSLTASFFRSFRVDDKRRIEFRIDSTNPINHVAITGINTTVGSIQYELPTRAGAMRSITATVRIRF
jgi:trimeric autotransporter adhesin